MSDGVRPVFVVKPGTVSKADIKRAERRCGFIIIECADPESARWCEPPMTSATLDDQARAALSLFRMVLYNSATEFNRGVLTKWFVQALIEGKRPEDVKPVTEVKRK